MAATLTPEIKAHMASLARNVENNAITALTTYAEDRIDEFVTRSDETLSKKIDKELAKLEKGVRAANRTYEKVRSVSTITVKEDGQVVSKAQGLYHKDFDTLMQVLLVHEHPFLVGPAGSGKSQAAQQAAEALGVKYYVQSVGAQTAMSHIFGARDIHNDYRATHFRDAYENGGVFCMDEIDAGNANVLVGINSALSNKLCSFPDAIVPMHPEFYFVGTGNTMGRGASRQYVGRNQLDEATLDRFTVVEWPYDENLERALAGDSAVQVAWMELVWTIREYCLSHEIRGVVSTRAILRGSKLLSILPFDKVVEMVLLPTFSADDRENVIKQVNSFAAANSSVFAKKPIAA